MLIWKSVFFWLNSTYQDTKQDWETIVLKDKAQAAYVKELPQRQAGLTIYRYGLMSWSTVI